MSSIPVITIDGPSGSGKGTVSHLLARHLGFHFLDSGALYRLLALSALRRDVPLDDEARLAELALALDVEFPDEQHVLLDGVEVRGEIRSETAGNAASRVAVLPAVRAALLERQRAFRQAPGLVADGRDMGTVVFPDAAAKIFLTASPEKRAERRCKQLKEMGIEADYTALIQEISERDARDANRAVAPLKPAKDAMLIDSSALRIEAVVEQALEFIAGRISA